ncbi:Down syndrome cell adhesion molecule-like protein Dscam2 [Galendromus occidentalis]|uniref:Down syndrome cell adhesion molecule-like protein Dscam2 n=1 Tax=Galendromus occidentalis TaxID=34638 RepID=A0AAJ7SJK8_9ACAR|nr:Down syndrome cell adhesion molecule-like protein Dscam2 [Galendromus occidentalis]
MNFNWSLVESSTTGTGGSPDDRPTDQSEPKWKTLAATDVDKDRRGGKGEVRRLPLYFLNEPPNDVHFLNTAGVVVTCNAGGSPPPIIIWQKADGEIISETSDGLRYVRSDGSLVFRPFDPKNFRPEVHTTTYRCVAQNEHGTLGSRDVHVEAVIDMSPGDVSVTDGTSILGGTAVLRCITSSPTREHLTVHSWQTDDGFAMSTDSNVIGNKYHTSHNGRVLLVHSVTPQEEKRRFRCSVYNKLTGRKVNSVQWAKITIIDAKDSPARMVECPPRVSLTEGETLRLPCVATGHPKPSYRWFRSAPNQPLPSEMGVLIMNKMTLADTGRYICTANNTYGEDRCDTEVTVTAPLDAVMMPRLLSVRSGDDATVNCTYRGGPVSQVSWTKDQKPLITDHRVRLLGKLLLHISGFRRGDSGVYQCYVGNLRDSAQGYAYLKVQEVAPTFQDTFNARVHNQGERSSLRCIATGSPLPQVSWLLDGYPVSESGNMHQGDFVQPDGSAVVSFVNISTLRVQDGGEYSCKATNDVGVIEHTARIDVSGPPFIRPMRNLTAITGSDFRLHCPVSGYPIESIRIEKEGRILRIGSRHRLPRAGHLLIQDVRREDQGLYRCIVQGAQGEVFTRDVYVHVVVPPKLAPFVFPSKMQAGHRATVTCAIVEGDSPIVISWQKDGRPLIGYKGVQTLPLSDFVSTLIIENVERSHSGNYTCTATNIAAVSNYTAPLVVLGDTPSWSIKPEDKTVIVGSAVRFDCRADGEPQPVIRWKVAKGDDFQSIASSPRIHVLENGSLTILSVERSDQGQYICEASNTVGPSATVAIALSVKSKPHVSGLLQTVSLKKESQASVQCVATGDAPLELIWSFNGTLIRPEHDVRISMDDQMVTEDKLVSNLKIDQVRKSDSGVIECTVTNPYGKESLHTRLIVQDKPEPPTKLRVIEATSSSITLQWETPPDGNSVIKSYVISYRQADSATPEESVLSQHRASFVSDDGSQSATIKNLLPRTTYEIYVAASNDIGTSRPSKTVNVTTKVDPPQKPPRDVEVIPMGSTKFRVRWRRPVDPQLVPIEGYYIGFRANSESIFAYKTHSLLNLVPRDVEEFVIQGLNKRTKYCVICQAYNEQGNGPSSKEVCASTFEYDPPESPRLKLISSTASSLHVSWEPRKGDIVQGYILHYKHGNGGFIEERLSRQLSSKMLTGLQCGTTYTIYLTAYNDVGHSEPGEFLEASTNGKPPIAPPMADMVDTNQTTLRISLTKWREAGCPILFFVVRYKPRDFIGDWIVYSNHIPPEQQVVYITDLAPASWYDMSVSGYAEAGHSDASDLVGTLTPDGRRLPPPPERIKETPRGPLQGMQNQAWLVPMMCVIVAIVVIIAVISVLVLWTRKRERLQELYNQTDTGNSMTLKTYPNMACKTSTCSRNGGLGQAFYYPESYSTTTRGFYPNNDRHTYEDPCKLKEQQMRAATAVDSSTLKRKVQIDATAFEGGKHRLQYSEESSPLDKTSSFLGTSTGTCRQNSMEEFEEMSDFGDGKTACYTSYGYKVPKPYPSTINEESSIYSDCTYRS